MPTLCNDESRLRDTEVRFHWEGIEYDPTEALWALERVKEFANTEGSRKSGCRNAVIWTRGEVGTGRALCIYWTAARCIAVRLRSLEP